MKKIIAIFITLFLFQIELLSFEIIEKKFKNSVQLDFNHQSGGSFYDINGKRQTELIRYVDSIRYTDNSLSPINYIFDKKEALYSLSAKYFLLENLATSINLSAIQLSMTHKEFFYYEISEWQTNQKISYNLKEKSQFNMNNYQLGLEYYFSKEKWVTNVNASFSLSGLSDEVDYSTYDTTDIHRIQHYVTKGDSILINKQDFSYAIPNVLSFGGLIGYKFEGSYLELGSNYLSHSDEFKDQMISYLGVELTNNDVFKLKVQAQYTNIIGDFDKRIPYRPFRANPQNENFNITAGISYIKDNIFAELNYGQTIYAKNSLNWGQIHLSIAYLF